MISSDDAARSPSGQDRSPSERNDRLRPRGDEWSPTKQRREFADLKRRVEQLEGFALVALSVVSSLLLVVGTFSTYSDAGPSGISIITTPAYILDETVDGTEVIIAIGFIGLAICTVIAMIIMACTWAREFGARFHRFAIAVGTMLVIGGLCAWLFSAWAGQDPDDGAEWGLLWFGAGVALYLVIINDPIRSIWHTKGRY